MTVGRTRMAPARRTSRAGAFLLVLLTASACERDSTSRASRADIVIELAHDTIRLPAGVELHEISVSRTATGDFEPATLRVESGDVVRFTAGDNGGHAVLFDGAALDGAVRDYLERTGQMRSPPLIAAEAAWVITLDGAPAGDYHFHCATHNAAGRITVTER